MIYEILIVLAILFTCIVGTWFAFRYYKKKKKTAEYQSNPPKEILELFNEVEQKMKGGLRQDGTTKSPHKILWEIARRNKEEGITGNNRSTIATEQAVNSGELCKQPDRREDIQTRTIAVTSKDKSIIRKHGTNNFKRIISRIRGRKSRSQR